MQNQVIDPTVRDFAREVGHLNQIARDHHTRILGTHPWWDRHNDVRLTTLGKLIQVTQSTQLAMLFWGVYLVDEKWWRGIGHTSVSSHHIKVNVREFQTFTKIGFTHVAFSSVESGLRSLLRAVDPVACNNGTAEFKSIYDCLLKSKLSMPPPEGTELLDLLRFIRNTVHNNSVFFNRRGVNEQVVYKGQTYRFEYGKKLSVATWDLLFSLVHDLIDLTAAITCDQTIANITGTIQDPAL